MILHWAVSWCDHEGISKAMLLLKAMTLLDVWSDCFRSIMPAIVYHSHVLEGRRIARAETV